MFYRLKWVRIVPPIIKTPKKIYWNPDKKNKFTEKLYQSRNYFLFVILYCCKKMEKSIRLKNVCTINWLINPNYWKCFLRAHRFHKLASDLRQVATFCKSTCTPNKWHGPCIAQLLFYPASKAFSLP